jgi:hypothetical protein
MHGLLRGVHAELTLRRLSRRERLALGAISLCALILWVALQHGRTFIGDEVATLPLLKQSATYLLTHFTVHLTMNYFILVEKWVAWLCGATDWRLTLLPLTAAVAIIPLTASLALKFTGSTRTALIAASLAAFNPYLIYWGLLIRSYSVLVALSLLAMNECFHWSGRRDWWSGVRCATVVLFLLLAHINGAYTVAFLILLLAVETISQGWSGARKFLWDARTLWIPLAGVAILIGIAYWHLLPDIAKINREWGTDTPPTSLGYLPQVFAIYMSMGVGYATYLCALLLLVGLWSAVREKKQLLLLCAAIMLAPVIMSLQGVSLHPSDSARYLIFSLPWLLILMAEGINWLAHHVRIRRGAAIVAWILTTITVLCWTPSVGVQFVVQKRWPYARVAKFLHSKMQKNDVIVAGWMLGYTLSQFFDDAESRIMLPDAYVNKVATNLNAAVNGRVFYITRLDLANGHKAPVRRFGAMEVTIYSGRTPRTLLARWREDLLDRTAGRVVWPFESYYQLLALLEERLSSRQSADHWRSLAESCRAQNPYLRDVPKHLQKAMRAVVFP